MKFLDQNIQFFLVSISMIATLVLVGCISRELAQQATDLWEQLTSAPDSTKIQMPSPAKPESASMDSYVSLFRNVVAGDYRVLLVESSGQVELTEWNRLNQITSYKKGKISSDKTSEIFKLFFDQGFISMNVEYDLYPLPEDSTLVYEDIYYVLKIQSDKLEKIVIAHEQVMPPNMQKIIAVLQMIEEQIQKTDALGNFLFAGDHQILGYKRFVSKDNFLSLTSDDLSKYSELRDALNRPFSLLPIKNLHETTLAGVLNVENNSLEVDLGGKHYDVLLLTGK